MNRKELLELFHKSVENIERIKQHLNVLLDEDTPSEYNTCDSLQTVNSDSESSTNKSDFGKKKRKTIKFSDIDKIRNLINSNDHKNIVLLYKLCINARIRIIKKAEMNRLLRFSGFKFDEDSVLFKNKKKYLMNLPDNDIHFLVKLFELSNSMNKQTNVKAILKFLMRPKIMLKSSQNFKTATGSLTTKYARNLVRKIKKSLPMKKGNKILEMREELRELSDSSSLSSQKSQSIIITRSKRRKEINYSGDDFDYDTNNDSDYTELEENEKENSVKVNRLEYSDSEETNLDHNSNNQVKNTPTALDRFVTEEELKYEITKILDLYKCDKQTVKNVFRTIYATHFKK
ncbi:unnamed protein product [Brachionus calyciflorus]|uniref:Uncharacterized protein n=1 Tax=Brachionus calyciflorus TaxID=104777 RepID=A0A814M0M8_9BILA|nr:unnamed protein product [Brachionus calyciflorus]